MNREGFVKGIEENITKYGFHLTIVSSATEPRYAYTIGLTEKIGAELIFAGGLIYLKDELDEIFTDIQLKFSRDLPGSDARFETKFGSFTLGMVHRSWSDLMGLGVFDYYHNPDIPFLQIIPDKNRYTLDIPDMANDRERAANFVWNWLDNKWDLSVSEHSTVVTNMGVLKGEPVTELMRWEEDEWEMFSIPGPDVNESEIRVLSIATLLGIDPTLKASLNLEVGTGLWRTDRDSEWNQW